MRMCPHCRTPYTTDVEHCGLDGHRLIDTAEDLLIGYAIDRFVLKARLGAGAMAAVYRAQHQVIDREAAVKVLFGEYASDKQFAQRFRREAQAAAAIKHKNIVEVFDFGETPEGANFLVMELLRGHSLSEAIQMGGAMTPRRAANVARDIAEGLSAAHKQGFIHRDLKPGNIFLFNNDGREGAKILDFGVVHQTSLNEPTGKLTNTGQTLGTPYYMAPEQIAGDDDLSERTDLYALGVVIYEMLEGRSPFRGSLGEVLVQHVSTKPEKLPPSGGLEKLVKRLLEKNPNKRPPSADAVVNELDRLGLGGPVKFVTLDETLPPMEAPAEEVDITDEAATIGLERDLPLPPLSDDSSTEMHRPPPRRSTSPANGRWPLAVAALLVLASIGGLAWVLSQPSAPPDGPPPVADAPELVDTKARIDRMATQIRAAADRRGLHMREVALIDELAGPYDAFRGASMRGDLEAATQAADQIVPGLATVAIPPRVLVRKLSRLEALLEDGEAPIAPKKRQRLRSELTDLRNATERELTPAERSQIALLLMGMERTAVDGAPAVTGG
jgi:serine/threonine protein kinase